MNQFSNGAFNFVDKTAQIGEGSEVWHYAVVLADCVIGKNVSVGSGAEIGRGTKIGDNSRIGSGVFLPSNSIVGHNCFIGPRVCATDDRYPRVNNVEYSAEPPVFEDYCSVGAGSVILPGVRIGKNAMVGAGSVVTRSVPQGGTVYGEKAKLREVNFKHLSREYGWVGGA
jgi:UDP-2-acetamido-3-amino-2,3-dideoxy-glucuronate N-acetyltransferase